MKRIDNSLNYTVRELELYEQLAVAIVKKAIIDYDEAIKVLKNKKASELKKTHARNMMISVQRFIDSEWFRTLVDIEPEIIKKHLKCKLKGLK